MVPLYDKLSSVIMTVFTLQTVECQSLFSCMPWPVCGDMILNWYTPSYITVQSNSVLLAHAHPTTSTFT